MPDQIKTVTDSSQFQFILDNFFAQRTVYIKTNSGNLDIQYLGYSDGKVAFRIPHVKTLPEMVVVFTRHKTNTIYLSIKTMERNEDTFVFLPVKFQILSESRKEDRKLVNIEGGKSIMYIDNLITDYVIERGLAISEKKIDKVKEFAEFELKKKFEYVKIVFINESKTDIRLKHVLDNGGNIYIPNLNVEPDPAMLESYNYYINNIYKSDVTLSSRTKYIAEITVPILYNGIIVYGYLQVNSMQPFTDGILEVCRRMTIVINQLMIKNGFFASVGDRFLLVDLSESGLSFVFKDKKYLRYFVEGSKIAFSVLLPTQKKSVIGAIVRNINVMDNGIIKLGCEIFIMDSTSRANYNEFLEISK